MSSTDPGAGKDAGLQPWHLFLLLGMVGATWAVVEARHTEPAALILISAAVIAAGAVAIATHTALKGFFGPDRQTAPLSANARQGLEEEKALVLRSIKELEFDRAMGKVGDGDFADLSARLRARALDVMQQLERPSTDARRTAAALPSAPARGGCAQCGTGNDADARFCKNCGAKL